MGRELNVFKKLVAWQFWPFALSSMSKRKPIWQSIQSSFVQAVAACCNARFLRSGVNLYICNNGFMYEFAICVSSPENFVLL